MHVLDVLVQVLNAAAPSSTSANVRAERALSKEHLRIGAD